MAKGKKKGKGGGGGPGGGGGDIVTRGGEKAKGGNGAVITKSAESESQPSSSSQAHSAGDAPQTKKSGKSPPEQEQEQPAPQQQTGKKKNKKVPAEQMPTQHKGQIEQEPKSKDPTPELLEQQSAPYQQQPTAQGAWQKVGTQPQLRGPPPQAPPQLEAWKAARSRQQQQPWGFQDLSIGPSQPPQGQQAQQRGSPQEHGEEQQQKQRGGQQPWGPPQQHNQGQQQQRGPPQQNVQGPQQPQRSPPQDQQPGRLPQQQVQGQQQPLQRGPPQQNVQGQQKHQRSPPPDQQAWRLPQQQVQGQQQPQQRGPPQQNVQGQQQPQRSPPPDQQAWRLPQQQVQGQQQPQQRGPPQQNVQGQQQPQRSPPPDQQAWRLPQQQLQGQQQLQQRGPPQQPQRSPPQDQQSKVVQLGTDKRSQQRPSPSSFEQISKGASPAKASGDQSIQRYRQMTVLSLAEQMAQMEHFKTRKIDVGNRGRKIPIETNHLRLDLGKLQVAYHYDVQIDPDTPKKFLREVMERFRERHFPRRHPAFDGRKNLYSPIELLTPRSQDLTDEIKINDDVSGREKAFKVKVQFANEVDLTPLHNIRMTLMSPQEAIQCVEIVLRSAPSQTCIQAGRSFFTRPASIIELGDGMEMYQGFYQSVVRGWKPLLNVDVAHKAFPKETNLIRLIVELCSNYRQTVTQEELKTKRLSSQQSETLLKFLRTLRIVYEIQTQPGSKREYRVNGLKACPRDAKFCPDNGPEMTVEDYFIKKKGLRLQYPLMPTIWVGSMQRKDPILLPAELCTVLPGQAVNRKMTENQTSAMIKSAATSTIKRKEKIIDQLRTTRHNENLSIREFGFRIGTDFEQIQARVLEPPALEYDRHAVTPSKGVWRQDNIKFFKGAQINSWTIISLCGSLDNVEKLAEMIYSFAPRCGMSLNSRGAAPFELLKGRPVLYRDIEACLKKCYQRGYDLVFVIIPDSGPTYSDVKKAAELYIGCLTQCIKRKTLFKLTAPTVNNILLKVNSKLNGTNHCLHRRPPILSRPCMIMGADVTHPSPDSQHIPSVAAVTASHDPKAFCYNISCRLQPPRAEIIADLQDITREHLLYFHKKCGGQKPERIIFFRDGVSEGQFYEVLTQEVRAIRSACLSLQKDGSYQPKITFLVVQKRHHTRFFPKNPKDSEDRNVNVPAGTCVDTEITNPMMQDFYLVSHASIQGVAKPTKYCTLWDDNDMSNDDIEELTYHLCHLFTRCNRSVSYPAPTYYAHLAAARAKVYIEQDTLDLENLQNEQRRINILDVIRKDRPMFFV